MSGIAGYPDGTTAATGSYAGDVTFGPTEAGTKTLITGGFFLARYQADGTLSSAASAVNLNNVFSHGIAATADGGAIVTGDFSSAVTFGGKLVTAPAGRQDMFLVRYDADGTVPWAVSAGGGTTTSGAAIATFGDGSSVVTGSFTGTVTFGALAVLTVGGAQDIFVTRFDASGTPVWRAQAGGSDGLATGAGFGIVTYDVDGSVAVVGQFNSALPFAFNSADFITTSFVNPAGGNDAFIARYSGTGGLTSARSAGGTGGDTAAAVAGFSDTGAIVTGSIQAPSSTFGAPVTFQTVNFVTAAAAQDSFVAKYYPY
jgi:hypothetical protein